MTGDDAAACPVPAIDWRFVSREEIARLAQQGLVATAADSADHRTIRDDIESLRRRRRLRHVAREASAELARVVAEWRNEDFRRCDPQAVAVLAAERHQRSLSCSNLGGIHRGTEDEREYGLSWASDGCENGLETTAVADERAQGTRASSRVEVPSKDSQSGSPSCASWGSNTSRHQQGVGSSVLLPELCPFPPMDWRHVAPAGSPLPSSHISNHDRDNASHSGGVGRAAGNSHPPPPHLPPPTAEAAKGKGGAALAAAHASAGDGRWCWRTWPCASAHGRTQLRAAMRARTQLRAAAAVFVTERGGAGRDGAGSAGRGRCGGDGAGAGGDRAAAAATGPLRAATGPLRRRWGRCGQRQGRRGGDGAAAGGDGGGVATWGRDRAAAGDGPGPGRDTAARHGERDGQKTAARHERAAGRK
ncbi:unnamed protein product [Closterium sp. NIES-54]